MDEPLTSPRVRLVRGSDIRSADLALGGHLLVGLDDGSMLQFDRRALDTIKDGLGRIELNEYRERHGFGRFSARGRGAVGGRS